MDKLLWPNGGVMLHADDFIFAEQAIRDAFAGILKGVQGTDKVLVLAGCEVSYTAGNATITEGWVSYLDEVLYMPAQTISTQVNSSFTNKVHIGLDVQVEPSGAEPLASGATGQTYQRRRAMLLPGTSSGSTWREDKNWLNLPYRINELAAAGAVDLFIQANDLEAGFTLPTPHQIAVKRSSGAVHIRGSIVTPGLNQNALTLAFTLPLGFRPTLSKCIASVTVQENLSYTHGSMHIETNGEVRFLSSTQSPETVYFCVTFW